MAPSLTGRYLIIIGCLSINYKGFSSLNVIFSCVPLIKSSKDITEEEKQEAFAKKQEFTLK